MREEWIVVFWVILLWQSQSIASHQRFFPSQHLGYNSRTLLLTLSDEKLLFNKANGAKFLYSLMFQNIKMVIHPRFTMIHRWSKETWIGIKRSLHWVYQKVSSTGVFWMQIPKCRVIRLRFVCTQVLLLLFPPSSCFVLTSNRNISPLLSRDECELKRKSSHSTTCKESLDSFSFLADNGCKFKKCPLRGHCFTYALGVNWPPALTEFTLHTI